MKPSGRAWRLAALVLVSAAVPCLVGEAVLRAVAPRVNTPGLFVPRSDELEYLGRPYAQGFFSGAPVSINGAGLRDRDHPPQPDPRDFRIIALGDSITFGQGVKEDQTFPRVAEAVLNRSRPDGVPPVEVLNFGIPGYNTLHEVALLKQLGLAFHPDMVVLEFLYNDLEISPAQRLRLATVQDGEVRGRAEHPASPSSREGRTATETNQAVPRRQALARLAPSINWLKSRSLFVAWISPRVAGVLRPLGMKGVGQLGVNDSQFVASNPDWRLVQAALLEAKRLCDAAGVRLVIIIVPAMTNFSESAYPLNQYHQAVADFCESWSIPVLDLLPAFRRVDGTRLWISLTDAHPNAEGHQIIGDALARFLRPQLERVHAERR